MVDGVGQKEPARYQSLLCSTILSQSGGETPNQPLPIVVDETKQVRPAVV
jgi:hypothetical protein